MEYDTEARTMSAGMMQCKDIADAPLLRFIAAKQAEKGMWVNTFEPPYSDLPDNLFRAKMGQLMKRG
ncbi:MAG: hypothetical protein M3536_03395, partial [Actinomycetota bacterium]|nr:hypothetical protein [Actinomycetota bacterium]